jgi:mevalonate kinase
MTRQGHACGKIIVSGEYAVLFGEPGLALPAAMGITVEYLENPLRGTLDVHWEHDGGALWNAYLMQILSLVEHAKGQLLTGTLSITSTLPLGKGMGSSTALVIACCRAILGEHCEQEALDIENKVNPGHSGVDFAAIWLQKPILFVRGEPAQIVALPPDVLANALLLDTGTPDQPTPELVAWVREHERQLRAPLQNIGECSRRIAGDEDISTVLRAHHRAQVALGVVPDFVQAIIAEIEASGGAAKVIGAGGQSGGAGMVLVLGMEQEDLRRIAGEREIFPLHA